MRSALPIIAAGTLLLSACRGQPSADPPVLLLRNMFDQQRYNPESASAFFTDHRTMRTPPAGTVAKEGFLDDDEIALGVRQSEQLTAEFHANVETKQQTRSSN